MQARTLITFILAILLAGGSVALAHAWLTLARDGQDIKATAQAADEDRTVPLAVAARALNYGDRLKPDDVKLVPWPQDAVPPGALHSLELLAVEPGKPGPIAMRAIEVNEPVLTSKITGFGVPVRLAASIAPGMRAATIGMAGAPVMAALIGPGDRVDVLIARDVTGDNRLGGGLAAAGRELRSDVLLRDVRVLGLDQNAGGPSSPARRAARAVTLEVTVEQAQKLALGQKIGTLSLALRGVRGAGRGASQVISSFDLPAGRAVKVDWTPPKQDAGGSIFPLAKTTQAMRSKPPEAAIRVFRGLESSEYSVSLEASNDALRTIDAAKAHLQGRLE
jgi:pilus assembly protein CpaB